MIDYRIFTLFVILFSFAYSSDSYYSGYIYNQSGEVLEGANIIAIDSKGNEFGASSDSGGYFQVFLMPDSDYEIIITFIGYNDYYKNISLNDIEKKITNQIITLDIKSIPLNQLEIVEIINTKNRKSMVGTSTSINANTISLIKPTGTQEMLEYIPGINGFSDDGIGNSRISIGIRGLNPRRSSRVLILEDGVPIQPALYVYPNMYYNPPSERISKVEVVKGSSSILYGPQTMGGVINYLTKRPGPEKYFTIKMSGGNNGLYSSLVEIGNPFDSKFNPNLQFLYKQGDGFRDNNSFKQFNITFKANYVKSKDESFYFKLNLNDEHSNATYTGLTQHSFEQELENKDSGSKTYNPKDFDTFDIVRASADLIYMKNISEKVRMTSTAFISYFDRKWWRENDVFWNLAGTSILAPNSAQTKVRMGDGQYSLGILRTFYVAGLERKYLIQNSSITNTEIGGRIYFERFIDDKKKGYLESYFDRNEGLKLRNRAELYYMPAEVLTECKLITGGLYNGMVICEGDDGWDESYVNNEWDLFVDVDGDGEYDPADGDVAEDFIDCNPNQSICEGDDGWVDSMGNGEWDNVDSDDHPASGQSHHYESMAFSGFFSQSYNINGFILKPGFRLEIFEQEKIDRLNGSSYEDKTTIVFLPGIGFNQKIGLFNIFGGVHRGFTPPSSGTIAIVGFGDNPVSDGLDLEAEKSWNKELGFRFQNNIIDIELSGFHVDIENLVAAGRATAFKNLGKIESKGIELGSVFSLSKYSMFLPDVSLAYCYLNTNVLEGQIETNVKGESGIVSIAGKELPYAPAHTMMIGLEHNFNNKFNSRIDFRSVSKSYTDFENFEEDVYGLGIAGPIPMHQVWNLSSTYKITNKFNVSLNVKNLFNELYIGSRLHSNPGKTAANQSSGIIIAPGRQINISFEYNFD
tara:strand:+ start:690 stop:3446 length:2757 start_codon:yes stop_codon:yes gene_type:complete